MKSAVIDNEGMIWGTGIDDEAALRDAYEWLNQDNNYSDYDDFVASKLYDSLKILSITDEAYNLVARIGGDYTMYRNGCHYVREGKTIMTKQEYEQLINE